MRTSDTVFSFSCAQSKEREHKPKVPKNSEDARSTERMLRFECSGWLHIAAASDSTDMSISIKHDLHHDPYKDIDLPDMWKRYIEEQALVQTPGQVRVS